MRGAKGGACWEILVAVFGLSMPCPEQVIPVWPGVAIGRRLQSGRYGAAGGPLIHKPGMTLIGVQ
jgi:hypothetical protein